MTLIYLMKTLLIMMLASLIASIICIIKLRKFYGNGSLEDEEFRIKGAKRYASISIITAASKLPW